MTLIVTGAIAQDYRMVFPGSFADQLPPEHVEALSLSFLVDELEIRWGGSGANIAFNLGWLGLAPVLVGSVGTDFGEYDDWLRAHGVDTGCLHVSATRRTARFLCTTDDAGKQIASFYSGAMAESRTIELAPVVDRAGGTPLVLVAPNVPAAMLHHTAECRARGYRFAADPSQQLARLGGEEVRALVDGAEFLFGNEYERRLIEHRTGWPPVELVRRVSVVVTTLGAQGVTVTRGGGEPTVVRPPKPRTLADPTGGGDAFRAGFLAGCHWGLSDERAAQLGCTLAVIALETAGAQEHPTDRGYLLDRLADGYGAEAAADVRPFLS
ncbi:carbohydrate kinase family protein [Phytohabitans sp. ZYX-F-186]|uniref:Carbohydrate kinase family protein n=1 Tax=Phytohabitans maris TaxID=3071409 RepID=A0ABU0ZKF7_9ACTN|nr:carbohydrate kinase family protein [Phytohabitans sp. ZYX-F-186]MDQ7907510.1 carbohydrate kinase family protein [Phytohabitans sp. ZYX-F-186]